MLQYFEKKIVVYFGIWYDNRKNRTDTLVRTEDTYELCGDSGAG